MNPDPLFRLSLQGPIKDDPDKEIIEGIINSIKKQTPAIRAGSAGISINIPDIQIIFKTFKGRDLQICVTGTLGEISINIKQLVKYSDVAWGFIDNDESALPGDMLTRLKKSR